MKASGKSSPRRASPSPGEKLAIGTNRGRAMDMLSSQCIKMGANHATLNRYMGYEGRTTNSICNCFFWIYIPLILHKTFFQKLKARGIVFLISPKKGCSMASSILRHYGPVTKTFQLCRMILLLFSLCVNSLSVSRLPFSKDCRNMGLITCIYIIEARNHNNLEI